MSLPTHAIVVAASAGGLAPLEQLVRRLPADLTASVFIVHHTGPTSPGYLAAILNRASILPCAYATDGEPMRPGRVYIAPPDRHLVITDDRLMTTSGPKENNVRPAADVLFRSAAAVFGSRVIGVVLSGMLDDGAEGLAAIVAAGGRGVVQDPSDALHASMPESALARARVDARVAAEDLGPTLVRLLHEPAPSPADADAAPGPNVAEHPFTCPECDGPIAVSDTSSGLRRFQCLVGHKYSEQSFADALVQARERTLWSAHRLLRQHALLHGIRADRARRLGQEAAAAHLHALARRAQDDASLIEEMIGPVDRFGTLVGEKRASADDREDA
jgi:two-component system, chemotaxis family, protein-glutamate methylesterase/glutaminase